MSIIKPTMPMQNGEGVAFYPLTSTDQVIFNNNKKLSDILDSIYPVGSIYETSEKDNIPLIGKWRLEKSVVIDTDWQEFTNQNRTYFNNTDQINYTRNQWRIKDNILYIEAGYSNKKSINTGEEFDLGIIPIINGIPQGPENRAWTAAIGQDGIWGGLQLWQFTDGLYLRAKPHQLIIGRVPKWVSGFFAIPLSDSFTFTDTNTVYTKRYTYIRYE